MCLGGASPDVLLGPVAHTPETRASLSVHPRTHPIGSPPRGVSAEAMLRVVTRPRPRLTRGRCGRTLQLSRSPQWGLFRSVCPTPRGAVLPSMPLTPCALCGGEVDLNPPPLLIPIRDPRSAGWVSVVRLAVVRWNAAHMRIGRGWESSKAMAKPYGSCNAAGQSMITDHASRRYVDTSQRQLTATKIHKLPKPRSLGHDRKLLAWGEGGPSEPRSGERGGGWGGRCSPGWGMAEEPSPPGTATGGQP